MTKIYTGSAVLTTAGVTSDLRLKSFDAVWIRSIEQPGLFVATGGTTGEYLHPFGGWAPSSSWSGACTNDLGMERMKGE